MNLLEILEKHNLSPKKKGKWIVCRCANPEHEDKHPSMSVNELTGSFKCFSCGFKGNITKLLATLGEEALLVKSDPLSHTRNKLLSMISQRLGEATNHIPADAQPLSFNYRGLTEDLIKEFKIFTSQEYKGRVCVPLYKNGKVYAITARAIDNNDKPKYLTTKFSSYLYPFPMDDINTTEVYLVEGIFDLFAMRKAGFTNTLCVFGISNRWIIKKALLELGVNKTYIVFDGEDAGQNAAVVLKEYLSPVCKVEIINLPFDLDPDTVQDLKAYLTSYKI